MLSWPSQTLGLLSVGLPNFHQERNSLIFSFLPHLLPPWKTLPTLRKGFGSVICTIAHTQITVGSLVLVSSVTGEIKAALLC